MRNKCQDILKSPSQRKTIFDKQLKCAHEDCNELITFYKGPGQNKLCREHQLKLTDYGEWGRLDRLHTFNRGPVCACCGNHIDNDSRWNACKEYFGDVDDTTLHAIKRRYMHSDHITRRADGGNDVADNIQSLCTFCHNYKTAYFEDHLRK